MVLVIRKEGRLPAVQQRSMLNAVVKMDFELSRPRRLTGRVLRSNPGGYSVQRTAPVFPDGEVIVDLGSILLSP